MKKYIRFEFLLNFYFTCISKCLIKFAYAHHKNVKSVYFICFFLWLIHAYSSIPIDLNQAELHPLNAPCSILDVS